MTTSRVEETKRPRHSHIFSRDEFDRYIEPEWVSERLFEEESFRGVIHDPAACTGRILAAARAAGYKTTGADIVPLTAAEWAMAPSGIRAVDFLKDRRTHDNVISNSPYRDDLIQQFAEHALAHVRRKVALLVPLTRLNAAHWLLATPLKRIWFISPRPSLPPLSYLAAGEKPGGGRPDYCWLLWQSGHRGPVETRWLLRDKETSQR